METVNELRRVRNAKGWSQKTMAKMLGVDISTVWRMEHGELEIRPMTALAIQAIDASHPDATTEPAQ